MTDSKKISIEKLNKRVPVPVSASVPVPVIERKARVLSTEVGVLVSEGDSVFVHTREAHRVFTGNTSSQSDSGFRATGMIRMASVLRELWLLTGANNHYADYLLINSISKLDVLKGDMQQNINRFISEFEAKKPEININVLRSSAPLSLSLTFRSPYGYHIIELLLKFDYLVRVIRTAIQKTGLDPNEGAQIIYQQTHNIRSIIERICAVYTQMVKQNLTTVNRQIVCGIVIPDSYSVTEEESVLAKKAVQLLGVVPLNVFLGQKKPIYTRLLPNQDVDSLKNLTQKDLSLGVAEFKLLKD